MVSRHCQAGHGGENAKTAQKEKPLAPCSCRINAAPHTYLALLQRCSRPEWSGSRYGRCDQAHDVCRKRYDKPHAG